jgi:hypothetical protein
VFQTHRATEAGQTGSHNNYVDHGGQFATSSVDFGYGQTGGAPPPFPIQYRAHRIKIRGHKSVFTVGVYKNATFRVAFRQEKPRFADLGRTQQQ